MGGPIRILHVVVNMNRGGAETMIMNLYRNVDRSLVQFDFLTSRPGMFDAEIQQLGGRIHRIPYISDVGHFQYKKALDLFFKKHHYYKVVHSHMDKMTGFVLSAAKKHNIAHRIAHSHNTQSEGNALAKAYKWWAGTHIKGSATTLLACSELAAQWLFKRQQPQATILKNGIDSKKFSFSAIRRQAIRTELQIHESAFVIGHVGRFAHQKNHSFLLDIFADYTKKHENAYLLLAGDGPLREDLKKKAQELNIISHVKFLGIRSDIENLVQAFDVFAFPSLHEGLPVTLVEAQGAALPCLISDTITKEVDLGLGLVTQLPIHHTDVWVEQLEVISEQTQRRIPGQALLRNTGYDVTETAQWAEQMYLALRG
ncbi:group 1 glycosyltransferase [Fictibacillus macauensis ZFHKF-1]|uniref:Group 1 glycosyltransferase n=1 Tax=Fictibacillus macauensis ZFHKF-1 TaxID=1196324 RepID=I8J438_9BACL|nr:glycosyltransferase family 1 protein [Fictibacillus macauensis]EIT86531.1 group 1 glycosyltransferase [Fictibacillus macauensis ZFHKF-1]